MSRPTPKRAIEARRQDAHNKEQAVDKALRILGRNGATISRVDVARLAGVSRSFTYENAHARAAIDAAQLRSGDDRSAAIEARSDEQESSWRERALNAEDRVAKLGRELKQERRLLGDALAQLRDPDGTWLTVERERLRRDNDRLLAERNDLTIERDALKRKLDAARSGRSHLLQRLAQAHGDPGQS